MVLGVELSEESCLPQNRWSHPVRCFHAIDIHLSDKALVQDPDAVCHIIGLAEILACRQLQGQAGPLRW